MATVTTEPHSVPIFRGSGWTELEAFIRGIRAIAWKQGKLQDPLWMANYASLHFCGEALRWHAELPEETQESWRKLEVAMIARWPPPDDSDNNTRVPTAAAASPGNVPWAVSGSRSALAVTKVHFDGTGPTWDYNGWPSAQPHELMDTTSNSADDMWWYREYMEHVMPRPGPGCLPPGAATEIHATYHQLYKVTVTPPSFPSADAQPTAGDLQRTPSTGQPSSSAGPPAASTSSTQHRPPSESEVKDLIPHPYAKFCRRDMNWVYHQVKSSINLPQMLPNSGTLPSEVVRKASATCVEVEEDGLPDFGFSSYKAKTHHFHHYPKSVKGSSLNPPFFLRKVDVETAAAVKRRRASATSSSHQRATDATSVASSEPNEIFLDLWVCCQCQTHVISSGPEADIPMALDGVLLHRYIRDRERELSKPTKEESVIYSLETLLRMVENFLFKLDGRMIRVGPNLIKKIGWTQAGQNFFASLGFQYTPVPATETEPHPEARLQPPKLTEGSPDADIRRARFLQLWLELSLVTQHYRKRNERALQTYESFHRMWASIENTFDETRRQIGAHETQMKHMPYAQSQLVNEHVRLFWDGLGTTHETHSADVVKFAYRRQTNCDPQNTPTYFYFLKGISDWAARVRHSSAGSLQILVTQEESRGRWSSDDFTRAAIILGFMSEDDIATGNPISLPPNLRESLRDAWLVRVKEVNAELSENRFSKQSAEDKKRELKEAFRILSEYSGSPELVQDFQQTMRMYGNGMVDVQDAYNTLKVTKELDEDMVVTIFNMRVEYQPSLRERMASALLVISEDRNSSRLKNVALTGKDDGPPPPESSRRAL